MSRAHPHLTQVARRFGLWLPPRLLFIPILALSLPAPAAQPAPAR
jgi:hypothetical protein